MDVTIIDAGIGNVRSVLRMFEEADVDAELVSDPADLGDVRKLVLPGVGAFDAGMRALNEGGWREPLNRLALERKLPVLGICLGMQLLVDGSEEGQASGLGWIPGTARLIDTGGNPRLKLPHMGWAEAQPVRENPLILADDELPRFYHVHKYAVECANPADVLATATYGTPFTTAINRGNIYGVQFHPEKSHRFGMAVLRRFARLQ